MKLESFSKQLPVEWSESIFSSHSYQSVDPSSEKTLIKCTKLSVIDWWWEERFEETRTLKLLFQRFRRVQAVRLWAVLLEMLCLKQISSLIQTGHYIISASGSVEKKTVPLALHFPMPNTTLRLSLTTCTRQRQPAPASTSWRFGNIQSIKRLFHDKGSSFFACLALLTAVGMKMTPTSTFTAHFIFWEAAQRHGTKCTRSRCGTHAHKIQAHLAGQDKLCAVMYFENV